MWERLLLSTAAWKAGLDLHNTSTTQALLHHTQLIQRCRPCAVTGQGTTWPTTNTPHRAPTQLKPNHFTCSMPLPSVVAALSHHAMYKKQATHAVLMQRP